MSSAHIPLSQSLAEIWFQFKEVHRVVSVERSETNGLYTVEYNCEIIQSETIYLIYFYCILSCFEILCWWPGRPYSHKRPKPEAVSKQKVVTFDRIVQTICFWNMFFFAFFFLLFRWINQEGLAGGLVRAYGEEETCIENYGERGWKKNNNWKT